MQPQPANAREPDLREGNPSNSQTIGHKHAPLRDLVRDELRAQIIDGRLPSGGRLIEQVLADQFGVSRVPVREALRGLEIEGLVTAIPRRGLVVTELSREDIEQLYDVRTQLETLAFGLAAKRATSKEVEDLSEVLEAARKAIAHSDFQKAVELNVDFHNSVIKMAANPFLTAALEPLTGRIRRFILLAKEHERDLTEHEGLLAAIAAGDETLVANRVRAHMEASRTHNLVAYDHQNAGHA